MLNLSSPDNHNQDNKSVPESLLFLPPRSNNKTKQKNGILSLIIKSNDLSPNLSFYPLLSFHKEGNDSRDKRKKVVTKGNQ